ncbi:MAG TPA: hypothetical protein PLA50_08330 [Bacteroidia bacterium]|nr:hypothetical protein [Bacteroidia bacterium]
MPITEFRSTSDRQSLPRLRTWLAILAVLTFIPSSIVNGNDWEKIRGWLLTPLECYHYPEYDRRDYARIEMPDGYQVYDRPGGKVVSTVEQPYVLEATFYTDIQNVRHYVTNEEAEKSYRTGRLPKTVVSASPSRSRYLEACGRPEPIGSIRKESIYGGMVRADRYQHRVPVEPVTRWGDGYRNAEIDFLTSAKVISFTSEDGQAWSVSLRIFPSEGCQFISPTDAPSHRDPDRYHLTILPNLPEIELKGTQNGELMKSTLIPGTVWAAGFSEGRIQHLRIGHTDMPPGFGAVSMLSVPNHRRNGDSLAFQFGVQRLGETSGMIALSPTKVIGADLTDYRMLERVGGPGHDLSEVEFGIYDIGGSEFWNIIIRSDETVSVVVPIHAERGAPGMIELEGLNLDPTYEEDSLALKQFVTQKAPGSPSPSDAWQPLGKMKLGPIPQHQRSVEVKW